MKLWKRITLICGTILIVAVAACSAIQLMNTRSTLYHQTNQNLRQKRQSLEISFQKMVAYHRSEEDSPAVTRALLHYCFSRLADSQCVLLVDGETVWSETELHPERIAPIPGTGENILYNNTYQGKHLIIQGQRILSNVAGNPECWIYLIEDCTPLDSLIRDMAWTFLAIGLACTVLGLGLVTLAVRRLVKPLQLLEEAAFQIAEGDYSQRAPVLSRDELGTLARSFNDMAEAVERHVEALTETAEKQRLFIGAVTHEFKTPLTGILLNADNLQNTYMTEEEQVDALTAIQTQGKWLERLVQQMLKLLTIHKEIKAEAFPASRLLGRVTDSTREFLARRRVTMQVQCTDFTIHGDIDLLQSALVNLIDNASKASQPGQTIFVTAEPDALEVKDHGCGIAGEALGHVTEAFYMADRSRSKQQGSIGLGLALVQEIVNAHGAVLWIESSQGAGTTVRIHFRR